MNTNLMESIVQKRAQSMGSDVRTWVKDNPMVAAGVTFGAGLLIGRGLVSKFRKN